MGTGDKSTRNSDTGGGGVKPTSSVDELTRQAHRRVRKGDLQGAMEHYEQAVEEAKSSSDPTVKISSFLNAGACLVSLGHHRRGLGLLESACKILKKAGATTDGRDHIASRPTSSKPESRHLFELSADVYFNAAVAAQGLQDFKKAVSSFKICIDHYMKAGAKSHAAEGFSTLAACYREAGQLDEEIASLLSARQLYYELEDVSNEAMTCMDLAKVYLQVGRKEECKEMVATAKLQVLRVDDPRVQGKLHSQFGLLYTSLGMFEEAIQNFEKALPLVRSGVRSANSLQVEASLLQNIGAAYNELGRFFDAVVYHREAAVLHGKTKNLISESKCLCNLAFAQAQLKDYPEAAKNFSNALAKAHKARNNSIQFQACEGLGAINYHMGRYGEAVSYFKQALWILDEIRQDTGMARERVMEKLSDAEEALQIMKAKQRQRDFGRSNRHIMQQNAATGMPGSGSDDSGSGGSCNHEDKISPHPVNRRLSPEFEQISGKHSGNKERIVPLSERRGVGFLPPIDTHHLKPSRKHAVPRKRNREKDHLPPLNVGSNNGHAIGNVKLSQQDSLDVDVQEYIKSYKERDSIVGTPSCSESQGSDAEHEYTRDSEDQSGARIFSRHAQRTDRQFSSCSPDSLNGGRRSQTSSPRREPVYQGCLAIGPNARELYTTRTRVVKEGRRKRRITEIIHKTPVLDNPDCSLPGSQPPTGQQSNARTSTQSKICVIL